LLHVPAAARQIRGKFFWWHERAMNCNVVWSFISVRLLLWLPVTALIGDDSSIRHRNIALAPCPRLMSDPALALAAHSLT
jgi:hypothetical protein